MSDRSRAVVAAVVCLSLAAAACGATRATESLSTNAVGSSPSPSHPVATPEASIATPGASATPPATSRPTPQPTASPALAWSAPRLIDPAEQCSVVAAVIDDLGGDHIAAGCGDSVRYSTSSGTDWTTTSFAHPTNRQELEPQLAFDGNALFIAYSGIALEDGGCGDPGIRDVGVFFRQRSLPAGTWSSAQPIGNVDDRLQSFRVTGGTIHATVLDQSNGNVYYETLTGGAYHRYRISGVIGPTSLRVGSDGIARVAFETVSGVSYAVFNGSGFSASVIPGSGGGFAPLLVFDSGNHAHLLWSRTPHGPGCAQPEGDSKDGTYYATDAGGSWAVTRISRVPADKSLAFDVSTARPLVLLGAGPGLQYLTKNSEGSWTSSTVTRGVAGSPVIKLDVSTGRLLVAYVDDPGVYVQTSR
jgi:hypothetical protein